MPTPPRSTPRLPRLATPVLALGIAALGACGAGEPEAPAVSGATGAELYASHCASCHGADLTGTDRGPSHLSIVYEPGHHGDDSFRAAVANGARQHHWQFGDMPAIPSLSDVEVDEIIAFVRAEQERRGLEPYDP